MEGKGREREGEKHQCVVASHDPPLLGTLPATQACALTGNQTGDPLVWQAGAQSTEPHQPGKHYFFLAS